jgi:dTDP-4-amino-4,6-dideoxygalactose transaminase
MIPLSRPFIGDEEKQAVLRVLESGRLAQGPEIESFEERFKEMVGSAYAISMANGTVALALGLQAAGIGGGDAVIVPSFTFVATANAVRLAGAFPVFADIDPRTFCIDPEHVESLTDRHTAAVVAVHLFGHPANLTELSELCQRKGLALVEDSAQALGTEWEGSQVGNLGILGSFSFYATKNMTTGEGGMVITDDADLAKRIRMLRNHRSDETLFHRAIGTNARITEISAALGSAQLSRLPQLNDKRRQHAAYYDDVLRECVTVPFVDPRATHSYHQYTIRVSNRLRLSDILEAEEIEYGRYYQIPCHKLAPYSAGRYHLPETDAASEEVISIPVHPGLSADQLETVSRAVIKGTEE